MILQARVTESEDLDPATLEQVRALLSFAHTKLPFGLWQVKDDCNFSSQDKASEIEADARMRWMDSANLSGEEPVYQISPGAQVFTFICANCHGPRADSKGRLAATIADFTGGKTRVANLRDGIFGPVTMPGESPAAVYGGEPAHGASPDDWAARYLVFMGMGGTQRTIPAIALDTVRNVRVLGHERKHSSSLEVSDANMLAIPKALVRGGAADGAPTNPFRPFLVERGELESRGERADRQYRGRGVVGEAVQAQQRTDAGTGGPRIRERD